MWILDTENWKWKKIEYSGKIEARRSHSCQFNSRDKNQIFIFGGMTDGNFSQTDDLICLDTQSFSFNESLMTQNNKIFSRYGHASATWNSSMFIFGGSGGKNYVFIFFYFFL